MSDLRIFLSGATGRMGREIFNLTRSLPNFEVVAGFAAERDSELPFPVFTTLPQDPLTAELPAFDLVVDFSSAAALPAVIAFAERTGKPLVTGSTGLTAEHRNLLEKLARKQAVFHAKNMSVGVTVMEMVAESLAKRLPDFDIEIVEKHHRYKIDAPSGTAVALFDAVNRGREGALERRDGRRGLGARETRDVGVQAVRGGTIVGEHNLIFAGEDEVLELTHRAGSRRIFAYGALTASQFIVRQPPGFYGMHDMLS